MKQIAPLFVLLFVLSASLAAAPVELIPPDFRGAVQPQVALAPGGRVHVVFGKDNAIYHTTSVDGSVFSTPVKVGELDKLALRMRRGPRISATDKLIVVTAISHTEGNLHSWTSTDGGATWKEGAHINDVGQIREGGTARDGGKRQRARFRDLAGSPQSGRRTMERGVARWRPDVGREHARLSIARWQHLPVLPSQRRRWIRKAAWQ